MSVYLVKMYWGKCGICEKISARRHGFLPSVARGAPTARRAPGPRFFEGHFWYPSNGGLECRRL